MKKQIGIVVLVLTLLLVSSSTIFADTTDEDIPLPRDSNIENPEDSGEEADATNEESLIAPSPTDDTEESGESGSDIINPFDISVTVGTQNPFNKSVPLWIVVKPKIDAERAEVTWDSRYGLDFEPKYEQFIKMSKDETYTLKTILKPKESGSYTLTVNVNEWGYGRNYTSSEEIPITFNEKLVTDPLTEGYETSKLVMYAIIAVCSVAVLALLIFGGKKVSEWLKEWLKPPEF